MEDRVECSLLRRRIISPEEAAAVIQNGMTVAFGGYTSSGYPKVVARELARRKKTGEELQIFMLSGSMNGYLEALLNDCGIISRRSPMLSNPELAKKANQGAVHYVEQQMNKMPGLLQQGAFGQIDVAVIEALAVTDEGGIIPTSSVGLDPHLLECAKKIIIEINTAQPIELKGLHDIFMPGKYPRRRSIPITSVNQKIGSDYMQVDISKICGIVASSEPDEVPAPSKVSPQTVAAVEHLLEFLEIECKRNYNGSLPPIQTGFGSIADEIARGLGRSRFRELQLFCGGMQEADLALIAQGCVSAASAGSMQMTPAVIEMLRNHKQLFHSTTMIRNIDVTNAGETIRRLGIFAVNSGIEMDIYGNVNSSHIAGNRVVNGLGGGANFAQNAELSILLLVSENKQGAISTIVPMVSHQDISEHDIDIVITENGVADLRGKDDLERARLIINNCAGFGYQSMLADYLDRAVKEVGGHHPQDPFEAFSWHKRLKETGTMKLIKV